MLKNAFLFHDGWYSKANGNGGKPFPNLVIKWNIPFHGREGIQIKIFLMLFNHDGT